MKNLTEKKTTEAVEFEIPPRMTWKQIKRKYPRSWVLIGAPMSEGMKIIEGNVIKASKDLKDFDGDGTYLVMLKHPTMQKFTLEFTGKLEYPKNWL